MPSDENVRAMAGVIFDSINLKVTADSAMRAALAVLDSGLVLPVTPVDGEKELRSRLDAFITVSYGAGYIDLDDLMDLVRPHLGGAALRADRDAAQMQLDQIREHAGAASYIESTTILAILDATPADMAVIRSSERQITP